MKRQKPPGAFHPDLIAPCGINCAVCAAFLRAKNPCFGCLPEYEGKGTHMRECRIKKCAASFGFLRCSECAKMPCFLEKNINSRYEKSWGTSLVGNLLQIHQMGLAAFVASEPEKWTCPACGGRLTIHSAVCPTCQSPNPNFRRTNFPSWETEHQ